MLERLIIEDGTYKGRIIDSGIAHELALDDALLCDELGGEPIFPPNNQLGKPETRYREVINDKLRILVLEAVSRAFDSVYDTPEARLTDPEEQSEPHFTVHLANILYKYEDYGFDKETCEEILNLEYVEAFQKVFSYLMQAGLDADEILKDFIEN